MCRGKTLGIVGYGSIGQACLRLAQAHQMPVIALRRDAHLTEPQPDLQVCSRLLAHWQLAERLAARLVTVSCSLTDKWADNPACVAAESGAQQHAHCALTPLCLAQVLPPERLHELMARSDFIVDCLPLSPSTRHMIDAAAIAAMKPTGVICNVGRGATIEQRALETGKPA